MATRLPIVLMMYYNHRIYKGTYIGVYKYLIT